MEEYQQRLAQCNTCASLLICHSLQACGYLVEKRSKLSSTHYPYPPGDCL